MELLSLGERMRQINEGTLMVAQNNARRSENDRDLLFSESHVGSSEATPTAVLQGSADQGHLLLDLKQRRPHTPENRMLQALDHMFSFSAIEPVKPAVN